MFHSISSSESLSIVSPMAPPSRDYTLTSLSIVVEYTAPSTYRPTSGSNTSGIQSYQTYNRERSSQREFCTCGAILCTSYLFIVSHWMPSLFIEYLQTVENNNWVKWSSIDEEWSDSINCSSVTPRREETCMLVGLHALVTVFIYPTECHLGT